MQAGYQLLVAALVARLRAELGARLVSAVIYGSVARGSARPDSDVDLLLVVRDLPRGPRARRAQIAAALDEAEGALQRQLPFAYFSVVLKTPDEVGQGGPLFYDMTVPGEAEVLHDSEGFFRGFLAGMRRRMQELGAERREYLGHPYWVLKADWKPGDVVDL